MRKVVIEKLGHNYCVFINNKTRNHVVFYSLDGLASDQAFLECRNVAMAIMASLGFKDLGIHYTDTKDAANWYGCDEGDLLKFGGQS